MASPSLVADDGVGRPAGANGAVLEVAVGARLALLAQRPSRQVAATIPCNVLAVILDNH
jgi:hypothetical protein